MGALISWSCAKAEKKPDLYTRTVSVDFCVSTEAGAANARAGMKRRRTTKKRTGWAFMLKILPASYLIEPCENEDVSRFIKKSEGYQFLVPCSRFSVVILKS